MKILRRAVTDHTAEVVDRDVFANRISEMCKSAEGGLLFMSYSTAIFLQLFQNHDFKYGVEERFKGWQLGSLFSIPVLSVADGSWFDAVYLPPSSCRVQFAMFPSEEPVYARVDFYDMNRAEATVKSWEDSGEKFDDTTRQQRLNQLLESFGLQTFIRFEVWVDAATILEAHPKIHGDEETI